MKKQNDLDYYFKLRISPDNMLAFLTFENKKELFSKASDEIAAMAAEFLKEKKIIYGVLTEEIAAFIKENKKNDAENEMICAMGDSLVSGSGSRLVFAEGIGFEKGKIINVVKDQIICYINSDAESNNGVDIYGNTVNDSDQNKVKLPKGENTYISVDGKTLHAKIDGCLEKYRNLILVTKTLTLNKSDLNFENEISAFASILIKGDVPAGSVIKSQGNIYVEGKVTASELTALGNITVLKSVYGKNKTIFTSEGSIAGSTFKNAKLNAACDIIASELIDCQVVARHAITVRDKGIIAGGRCYAAVQITAKQIGNLEGVFTSLRVGTSRKKDKAAELRVDLVHKEQGLLRKNLDELEVKVREYKSKIKASNNTPDSAQLEFLENAALNKKKIVLAIRELDRILANEFSEDEKDRISLVFCNICCSGAVYPNTHLEIGIESKDIEEKVSNVRFYIGEGIESMMYKN